MSAECSTKGEGPIGREERLLKYTQRCQILATYLKTKEFPTDLPKNEARNLKNQCKTHKWDAQKMELILMFGRYPRTPLEMEETSDGMSNIEEMITDVKTTDVDLDDMVSKRADLMTRVNEQVQQNVDRAQIKQREDYSKKKAKGVKVFHHCIGDLVLRKAMKNVGRKGGKMEPLWTGPYRILEIDSNQRISIAHPETGKPLKVKVPYDQVKPHSTSNLYSTALKITKDSINTQVTSDSSRKPVKIPTHSSPEKSFPKRKADVYITKDTGPKIRKVGPVDVLKPAYQSKDIPSLTRSILRKGTWLADEHIDHAQSLLSRQVKDIGGCQSVCVFQPEECQMVGTPDKDFIQILNISGNHWLTVSNIGCAKDTIVIYDSLNYSMSTSYKNKFLRQLAFMLYPSNGKMTLKWADMRRQVGSSDCGLFAISTATALCHSVSPQDCLWDQELMRCHLFECFKQGELSPFPGSAQPRSHDIFCQQEVVEVFCHCRQPYTNKRFMIECNQCRDWFHRDCEKVPKVVEDNIPFLCKHCK